MRAAREHARVASESVRRRRRAPPSGRCAITWMPLAQAVLDHAAQKTAVVPDAELDLHRGNLGDLPGLLDLRHVDVAQADLLDQSVASKAGQRADARRQRRSRIGRMELIELDALDAERPAARLARGNERSGASVFDPVALRTRQTAFRRD